jgi:HTH-type transcriptional regulator/antitoxin MqsA
MKCPVCGSAELVHDTRDLPYTYKGESTVLLQVTGNFCPACREGVLDAPQSRRVSGLMRESSKEA